MIKNLIAILLLYSLIACNQTEKKQIADLPLAKEDSFEYYGDEYNIPIPGGFSVDTIIVSDKKAEYIRELILPKVVKSMFNELNKVLTNEIKRKADLSYGDTTDALVYPVDKTFDITEEVIPLKMYKSEKLVSYGFLDIFSEQGMMRPLRKYFTVNYDVSKSKFIFFNEYFDIKSSKDSSFLKQLIFGIIRTPGEYWPSLNNNINFSIDEQNVYFYYDMFGELGNPMGLVYGFKRKYLLKFIKDEYK